MSLPMQCLVVWAHPDPASYNATLCETAVAALRQGGHQVTLLDLYRMGFDPVLSPAEKTSYLPRTEDNIAALSTHVDALKQAEALIVIYPTWMYGPPAILKGWLDRVMLPGVAFRVGAGAHRPITGCLDHIRCFVGITTSGAPWWWLRVIGDPGRSLFMRGLRPLFAKRCRSKWLQLHGMNHQTLAARQRFVQRVHSTLVTLN